MNNRQKKAYDQELKKITQQIVIGYKPKRIILFGSMLERQKESNDIDLFIIKKTNLPRMGNRVRAIRKFLPDQRIPVDFIVYTPQEITREIKRGNVFIAEILEKGKLLYEEKI